MRHDFAPKEEQRNTQQNWKMFNFEPYAKKTLERVERSRWYLTARLCEILTTPRYTALCQSLCRVCQGYLKGTIPLVGILFPLFFLYSDVFNENSIKKDEIFSADKLSDA
jgi:hypothetical protein